MDAKELRDLATEVNDTEIQCSRSEMVNGGLELSSNMTIYFTDNKNSSPYSGGRLRVYCEKIIKEKSDEIIVEAKKRLLKQLEYQKKKLVEASLEYATGMKLTTEK